MILGSLLSSPSEETQVVARLLQGKTYRTIASELIISENTVKTHVKNIYSKLQVRNRSELIDLVAENRKPSD